MSKSKRRNKKKQSRSFSSRHYATRIAEAIKRDLSALRGKSDSIDMFIDGTNADILKKFTAPDSDQSRLEALTYAKFLRVNEHMANFVDIPVPELRRIQTSTDRRSRILLRARALVHQLLGSFSLEEIFLACANSSGASLGVSYSDTSQEAKFRFPITVTEDALPLLEAYYVWDTTFQAAVQGWNRANPVTGWYTVEHGSRAMTVDKTDLIRRMICVEPTGNMFLQQGMMQVLYGKMKKFGLDVRVLPNINRELARVASITGRDATIDWTSASDCVSVGLIRWLMPPDWFRVLNVTRSKSISIGGESVKLNMFSTMGNAATFPLETLAFWAIACAVIYTEEDPRTLSLHVPVKVRESVSVFGDDCIVPTKHALAFIAECELAGFLINDEKSFYGSERFRESCGGDFLHGNIVRPLHVRAPTSERPSALEPWLYTIMNKTLEKYILYFGSLTYVYDKGFLKLMAQLMKRHKLKLKFVPPHFPEDSGLRLSCDWQRIQASYDFTLSPIKVGVGDCQLVEFKFCKYRLNDEQPRSDDLRYALALKFPTRAPKRRFSERVNYTHYHVGFPVELEQPLKPEDIYRTKRKGGYVIASSATSQWEVDPGRLPRAS